MVDTKVWAEVAEITLWTWGVRFPQVDGISGECKGKTPVVDEPNDGVSYTTWGSSLVIY